MDSFFFFFAIYYDFTQQLELGVFLILYFFDRPTFMDSSETLDSDDSQINLLILGSGGFAQAMESEIRVCTCIYYLSLLIVFGYRLYGVIIKTEIITIIMVIIEQNCLSLISRLKTFTYNLLYFNISMQVFHTVPYIFL